MATIKKKTNQTPDVGEVLENLEREGSRRFREEQSKRYGIVAKKAYGVPMAKLLKLAKTVGRDHELADALWRTGVYEARLLAAMVDEPERVTPAQMDRWAREFENWSDCDTVCFKLFDQTPHAFAKVDKWAKSREEFVKRGAFALLASLALHRKDATDADFVKRLPLIEQGAKDERNFVKKGVSWALRAILMRKSPKLRAAAKKLAEKLAESTDASSRSIGKEALRELSKRAS